MKRILIMFLVLFLSLIIGCAEPEKTIKETIVTKTSITGDGSEYVYYKEYTKYNKNGEILVYGYDNYHKDGSKDYEQCYKRVNDYDSNGNLIKQSFYRYNIDGSYKYEICYTYKYTYDFKRNYTKTEFISYHKDGSIYFNNCMDIEEFKDDEGNVILVKYYDYINNSKCYLVNEIKYEYYKKDIVKTQKSVSYDENGNIYNASTKEIEYIYDDNENEIKRNTYHYNENGEKYVYTIINNIYEEDRLIKEEHIKYDEEKIFIEYTEIYEYDNNKKLCKKTITDYNNGALGYINIEEYEYNDLNLTSKIIYKSYDNITQEYYITKIENFQYDDNGNVIFSDIYSVNQEKELIINRETYSEYKENLLISEQRIIYNSWGGIYYTYVISYVYNQDKNLLKNIKEKYLSKGILCEREIVENTYY